MQYLKKIISNSNKNKIRLLEKNQNKNQICLISFLDWCPSIVFDCNFIKFVQGNVKLCWSELLKGFKIKSHQRRAQYTKPPRNGEWLSTLGVRLNCTASFQQNLGAISTLNWPKREEFRHCLLSSFPYSVGQSYNWKNFLYFSFCMFEKI